MRPSTAIQVAQAAAIDAHNKALPPRKRAKETLPQIQSANVGITQSIKKDYKKGKTELLTKYTPVGVIDDYFDSKEADGSKFSILGKVRNMGVNAAKQKIDIFRRYNGQIIAA